GRRGGLVGAPEPLEVLEQAEDLADARPIPPRRDRENQLVDAQPAQRRAEGVRRRSRVAISLPAAPEDLRPRGRGLVQPEVDPLLLEVFQTGEDRPVERVL